MEEFRVKIAAAILRGEIEYTTNIFGSGYDEYDY
jgi:hypothetical protein